MNEWMNGQMKTVHQKYSPGIDIHFLFYNHNVKKIIFSSSNTQDEWMVLKWDIYICCSLSLMASCFKIKYDHVLAQNDFLGFWLLINGKFSSIPRCWFIATMWKTSWIDPSLQFPQNRNPPASPSSWVHDLTRLCFDSLIIKGTKRNIWESLKNCSETHFKKEKDQPQTE